MMPLRALPATGGGNTANANKANALAAKGNNSSSARRAAVLLLASPEVVDRGGEDLLLTVARLLRGVAARGRDLGGGSAEWAYDLLLPDSAKTTSTSRKVADDADDEEKQRRASSCAAAASSGRAVAEVWKAASGACEWIECKAEKRRKRRTLSLPSSSSD